MILHASVHACVRGRKCVGEHDGWALEETLFTLYECVRINVIIKNHFKILCVEFKIVCLERKDWIYL